MNNTLYYGEIAALIAGKFHQNPDHLIRIINTIGRTNKSESIWALCADAANVFDKIEDLSDDYFINSHRAVEIYSQEIIDFLLSGKKPNIIDMVSIAAHSIKNTV